MHIHLSVFTWNARYAPWYLADHVAMTSSVTLTLEVPKTHLSFGDRAFSVAGPCAWSSLPINIRSAQSIFSFRKLSKTFLFQRVYSWLKSCFNIVRPPCSIFCVNLLKFVIFTLHCITTVNNNLQISYDLLKQSIKIAAFTRHIRLHFYCWLNPGIRPVQ